MIWCHFFRSIEKLLLVVPSSAFTARADRPIMAQAGALLQPFCGALMSASTPKARMSTHTAPEATQSSTNSPPTACTASPMRLSCSSGIRMPLAVSTWGTNTTPGLTCAMAATISSIGAGAQGACGPSPVRRAFSTVMRSPVVMPPASRIWLQR